MADNRPPYVWPYNSEETRPCDRCGVEIWFATTKAGKSCPVTKSTGHMHFIDCAKAGANPSSSAPPKQTTKQTETIQLHEADDRNTWTLKIGRDLLQALDGCTFNVTFKKINLPAPDGRGPGTIILEIES